MEAACRSRRRKTRHLGLSCDLHLQTGRALLSLRPRLGPAVSHLLSQIRYRDVPDWRYPQPRVSPVFPGHTCRSIPTDICLRSQTHEKTRWVLDEASSSLSMHSATEVSLLSHAVRNLHFLSKNSTLISRGKLSNCFGWKLVKMLRFWTFYLLTTLISREKLWKRNWVKNSWKCWGFGHFSCWHLWFPEKNGKSKFWTIWLFEKCAF